MGSGKWEVYEHRLERASFLESFWSTWRAYKAKRMLANGVMKWGDLLTDIALCLLISL